MLPKSLMIFLCAVLTLVMQTGCKRSVSDVWEDAKTAGRQFGRSVRTLAGERPVSRQVRSIDEFRGPVDNDFVPLEEEDLSYSSSFKPVYQMKNAPAPAFEPGERGSPIPGIEQFSSPASAEEQKVFKHVHFDTNEFTVRGVENKQIISQVVSYLKSHPRTYIYVEGHCDQRGAAAYNFSLGAKRSHAVRNQIVEAGISSDRVHTVSYGKEKLLDQGSSLEALSRNRRVEFKLYNP